MQPCHCCVKPHARPHHRRGGTGQSSISLPSVFLATSMPHEPSAYATLGVDEAASDDAVRAAYLRAVARAHPDRVRSSASASSSRALSLTRALQRFAQGGSADDFRRVQAAYAALRGAAKSVPVRVSFSPPTSPHCAAQMRLLGQHMTRRYVAQRPAARPATRAAGGGRSVGAPAVALSRSTASRQA